MNKIHLTDRIRYHFDNFMSRGTIAMVAALFAVTLCMILSAAAIMALISLRPGVAEDGWTLQESIWQATMRTIDTGTVAGDVDWSFRGISFLVTLGGIFITSALIGILASGLEQRLGELRRGRSRVIEEGHTIILGWSPQVFTIVNELAFANRNLSKRRRLVRTGPVMRRTPCVAILADRDKPEMEEEIRTKVPDTFGTRVVCRSGNPLDPDDLRIVSPETARAMILLSPGGPYPDMPIVKSLLALRRDHELRTRPYHIVMALQRLANRDLVHMIGGDEAQAFLIDRFVSYLIAQTCRQPGLSVVYAELFSFEGAAIYFNEISSLVGVSYGDAQYRFENSTLIGLQYRDGTSQLNPPANTVIQPGDRVISIAKDDDATRQPDRDRAQVNVQAIRENLTSPMPPDRLLILGWNRRAPQILEQLSYYMTEDSHILVSAALPVEQMQAACAGANIKLEQVTFEQGNPIDRASLEKLDASRYNSTIILSPTDVADIQLADAATMISLLHLRDIAAKIGQELSVVSEIMDVRNLSLTQVSRADDVIISERLVALALTQIAENKDVVPVFVDLLTSGGHEIYLKPAIDYVLPGCEMSFDTVIAAAQRKGETAIGYRLLAEAARPEVAFGVHLNPVKTALISFTEEDRVIVLAEE